MPNSRDAATCIESILRTASAAVEREDFETLVSMFDPSDSTFLFDFSPPRRIDLAGLRRSFGEMAESADGPVVCEVEEVATHVLSDTTAWTAAVMRVAATMKDGTSLDITYRATDIWRMIDGKWLVVHEHASMPVDPLTGQADLTSSPR